MKNDYEILGDVTAIAIISRKHGTIKTLISTEKLQRAEEFDGRWYASWDNGTRSFYVLGHITRENGKRSNISLQRWITYEPNGEVDHIDHDTLNNTNQNLRIVSRGENCQNKKGAQKNSKSGRRGVSWNKSSKKWMVQVRANNKVTTVGLYEDIEEADLAAKEARMKLMPYTTDKPSARLVVDVNTLRDWLNNNGDETEDVTDFEQGWSWCAQTMLAHIESGSFKPDYPKRYKKNEQGGGEPGCEEAAIQI